MTDQDPEVGLSGADLRGTGRDPLPRSAHPAITDELTGLPNRLYFDMVFEVVFEVAERGIPVTLVQYEIDGMEAYREEQGDEAADEAIKEFGLTIGATTRRSDLFARLEGPRFVALLVDCNLHGGLIAAGRMEDLLEEWRRDRGMSFSAGLATWRPGIQDPKDLWNRSELALANAKQKGGGGVGMHDED